MKIASLNCLNFKTNRFYIDKLLAMSNIVFLSEHWLNSEESNLLSERYINFNIFFQSDMDIRNIDKNRGRPFGGKCWLVEKRLEVISCDFDNQNYSIIKIRFGNQNLVLIGVWVQFDDGSKERLLNFKSTISAFESLIEDCDSDMIMFLGDWNCDVNRSKRFDKLFKKFINENNLVSCDSLFSNSVNFTYKKNDYSSIIDYILIKQSDFEKIHDFKIIQDFENLSDHNPIWCELNESDDGDDLRVSDQDVRKLFHFFDWKNLNFSQQYNRILSGKLIAFINKIVGTDLEDRTQVCTLLDDILRDLPKSMLKAARETEKILGIKKKKTFINASTD